MNFIFDPENEKRPYIAANAIILRKKDNQEWILLGKRKNVAGAGFYYPPGGHIREREKNRGDSRKRNKRRDGFGYRTRKTLMV